MFAPGVLVYSTSRGRTRLLTTTTLCVRFGVLEQLLKQYKIAAVYGVFVNCCRSLATSQ